jgi:hypothetical protein
MRAILILSCALALPTSGEACPDTLAAAANGILITYANGASAELTRDLTSGKVVERFYDGAEYRAVNDLDQGIHMLGWTGVDALGAVIQGSQGGYDFKTPLPTGIAPGQEWSVDYQTTGRESNVSGTYVGKVAAEEKLLIGQCTYDVLPVTMSLTEEGFVSLVRADYIPALGLSILRAYGEPAGETTLLTPITIKEKGS